MKEKAKGSAMNNKQNGKNLKQNEEMAKTAGTRVNGPQETDPASEFLFDGRAAFSAWVDRQLENLEQRFAHNTTKGSLRTEFLNGR
ncbi:MAG: hypothetical protein VX768_07055 [Planctomycetota bacterium]|nr:hypothetical protein [Planctomycetota bacterium]